MKIQFSKLVLISWKKALPRVVRSRSERTCRRGPGQSTTKKLRAGRRIVHQRSRAIHCTPLSTYRYRLETFISDHKQRSDWIERVSFAYVKTKTGTVKSREVYYFLYAKKKSYLSTLISVTTSILVYLVLLWFIEYLTTILNEDSLY